MLISIIYLYNTHISYTYLDIIDCNYQKLFTIHRCQLEHLEMPSNLTHQIAQLPCRPAYSTVVSTTTRALGLGLARCAQAFRWLSSMTNWFLGNLEMMTSDDHSGRGKC